MDLVNIEVPVEILVDIKEDNENFQSSNTKNKTALKPSSSKLKKLKTEIKPLSDKDSNFYCKNCPLAVLVDVSPPNQSNFKDTCVSCASVSTKYSKDESAGYEISNAGNHVRFLDSKEKFDRNLNYADFWKIEDLTNSSNSNKAQCEMPVKRLRWKTPSPKSMSRISKEASKVIDQLNSSSIFNEDLLLTEEMLPITLNFDEFDDTDEKDDNVFEDIVLNKDLTFDQQMLCKIEKNNIKSNICSSKNVASSKFQASLDHGHVEKNVNESSFTTSNKSSLNSKESSSSGIHSSPLGISDSLTFRDEVDVFNVASEDKENLQNKRNIGNKTVVKISSLKKSKLDQHGRLKNLSNIKTEASVKHLSVSVNENITTPLKRMSISARKKVILPHAEKPQVKKTTLLVDSRYSMKDFCQSRCKKVSNMQNLQLTKMDSGCSSLSSDVKQKNLFATPSRRYSICTPLKSASAIKPPLTPALNSSNTFAFPRYTPQPVKPSRLSFSRSWQQSGGNSQLLSEKKFKQQISTSIPSSSSKIESGVKNSAKPVKLSFSQSMSSVSAQSLGKNPSSNRRFSNKLPSSLVVDKKVARALFTNVSVK